MKSTGNGVALVSGATGFVGSHLVRRLVRTGFEVHVLCRHGSNLWRLNDCVPGIRMHVAPIEDAQLVRTAVRAASPDFVFHLAASTIVAGKTGAAPELSEVNLTGTLNLLEACEDVPFRGLVTTGDSFEYTASHCPLSEDDPCLPDTIHGVTKLAATLSARSVALTRGRPIVTLRLFSTYGPGDHPRRLVPRAIAGALAGEPLILSRRDIVRDWVYVDDVVDLYLEAANRASSLAGQVFNAGSGVGIPIGGVVEAILGLTGSKSETRWGAFPAPQHDDYPWVANPDLTFSAFDWRPKTTLEEGLAAAIRAHRNNSPT